MLPASSVCLSVCLPCHLGRVDSLSSRHAVFVAHAAIVVFCGSILISATTLFCTSCRWLSLCLPYFLSLSLSLCLASYTRSPPGSKCPFTGTVAPTLDCDAGFVCASGTSTPNVSCPAGFFCAARTAVPAPCAPGSYADVAGLAVCKTCPARSFCAGASVTPVSCPAGSYCPVGTRFATQFLCLPGTFSNATGLAAATECTACTPGMYCALPGLTAPTGFCGPRYYCSLNASSPQPNDGNRTGGPCAEGYLCDLGSVAPVPMLGVGGPTGNGTGRACRPGTWCGPGASVEIPCSPSTYNPNYGQGACLPCPAGHSCPIAGLAVPQACPPFRWCPEGSSDGDFCPRGSYSLVPSNFSLPTECLPCPSGSFCQNGNITGPCAAGYWCR